MAVAVAAVASIVATFALPASTAYANSVPAPTLVSPASSATAPLKDVVLQWNPVAGASQYQVQVSPNKNWTNNAVDLPVDTTVNTLLEMPVGLPHAAYFWRVRAMVGGVWGTYSAPWEFLRDWDTNISIVKPPTSDDPTISWAPISQASEYVVNFYDLGTTNAPTNVLKMTPTSSCTTEQTTLTPYDVLSGTDNGAGACTVNPEAFVNGDFYQWSILAYDDTSGPSVSTDFFGNDPNCTAATPECSGYLGASYVSPTAFQYTAPTGSVAFDPKSTATGLTTSWRPAASAVGTPCGTSPDCPVTPTFSWDPVPHANFYQVHIYLDPLDTNDFAVYDTNQTHFTPRDFFLDAQAGGWYYWTVQPGSCVTCDVKPKTENVPCPSDRTDDGFPADLVSVEEADPPNTPVNVFAGIPAGGTYKITLAETRDTGSPPRPGCALASTGNVYTNPVSTSGQTVTFDWQAPLTTGKVTFTAVDQNGSEHVDLTIIPGTALTLGVESAPVAFGKSSGPVTLSSPANGATLHGGSVTFRWQDFLATGGATALEAKNYELQVSQDPQFDSTVIDQSDIDLTQFTNPSNFLDNGSYYWRVIAIDESGTQLTWSAVRHFTVDANIPTVSITSGNGLGVTKKLEIQTSERLKGVKTSTLRVVPEGKSLSHAVPGKIRRGATSTLYTFTPDKPLGTGVTYVLVPMPSLVDGNGNPIQVDGAGVRTRLTAKATSPGWHYSRGWVKEPVSSALSGKVFEAAPGRVASLTVGGSEAHLFACVGPHFGKITISVAGHSQTVSEHQKHFTSCGVEIWHRALPDTSRKLTISVVKGLGNLDEVTVD
jgi:hypothetical protein